MVRGSVTGLAVVSGEVSEQSRKPAFTWSFVASKMPADSRCWSRITGGGRVVCETVARLGLLS